MSSRNPCCTLVTKMKKMQIFNKFTLNKFTLKGKTVFIGQCYTPTNSADTGQKDTFYDTAPSFSSEFNKKVHPDCYAAWPKWIDQMAIALKYKTEKVLLDLSVRINWEAGIETEYQCQFKTSRVAFLCTLQSLCYLPPADIEENPSKRTTKLRIGMLLYLKTKWNNWLELRRCFALRLSYR